MDDILNRSAGLQLSEKEGAEVIIGTPVSESNRVLAGKFFTKRRVNLESVARVLRSIWKTNQSFEVSDLGDNKAFFLFQNEDDADRVRLQGPWSFDKYFLALHKLRTGEAVNKIKFDRMALWIQIHGIPTTFQTKEVGHCIGTTIGSVESVDANEKGFCLGSFMRVRVMIDISHPLCRGRKVRLGDSSQFWVDFKYERMPIFCYLCGMVTHDENDCLVGLRRTERMNAEDKPFGPWLRATQERLQKPQLVLATSRDSDMELQKHAEPHIQAVTGPDQFSRCAVKGNHPQATMVQDNGKGKANVGVVEAVTKEKIPQIPHKQHECQFEEQLKVIDAAIFGETANTTNHQKPMQSTGMAEVIQTNDLVTQTQCKVEEEARIVGPQEMSKNIMVPPLGPQPLDGPANKVQVNLSTIPKFIMGPTSPTSPTKPKPKKASQVNLRKGQVGPAMQRKENVFRRGIVRVNSKDMGTESMEVEKNEKCGKRRTRPLLEDMSDLVENVKRKKVEGDVMALSKLMAQELGSVVAAGQPRREQ